MEQRTWIDIEPIRVYVTIGFYDPEDGHTVNQIEKGLVVINPYPDTAIAATLRFRETIAESLTLLDCFHRAFVPEDLFFMVYRTWDPNERPYIYSDNSPRSTELLEESKERSRRSRLSKLERVVEDFKKWISS